MEALIGTVKLTASRIIKGIARVASSKLVAPLTKAATYLWSRLARPTVKGVWSLIKAVLTTTRDMIHESMSQVFSKEFWVSMAKDGARELLAGVLMSLGSTVYKHGTHKQAEGGTTRPPTGNAYNSAFSTNTTSSYASSNPTSRSYFNSSNSRAENLSNDNMNKIFGFTGGPSSVVTTTPPVPAKPNVSAADMFPPRDTRAPSHSVWAN